MVWELPDEQVEVGTTARRSVAHVREAERVRERASELSAHGGPGGQERDGPVDREVAVACVAFDLKNG